MLVDCIAHSLAETGINFLCKPHDVFRTAGVIVLLPHGFQTGVAVTRQRLANVKKNTRWCILFHDFIYFCRQQVCISSVEAKQMEPDVADEIVSAVRFAFVQPFRVRQCIFFVMSGRKINRHIDADLPASVQLRTEQIKLQMRMDPVYLGGMIRPSVMTWKTV